MAGPDHYHCPADGCYWRIQFVTTCSRCGGPTVAQPGCCAPYVPPEEPYRFLTGEDRD